MVAPMAHESPVARRRVSTMTHTPTSAPNTRSKTVSDDLVLLLQEWLTMIQFPATLKCLMDEYTRELKRSPPEMDAWVELTQRLDLRALGSTTATTSTGKTSLLERVLEDAVARCQAHRDAMERKRSLLPPHTTTIVVSKRPLTASSSHPKFAAKRSLPIGGSMPHYHSKSTSSLAPSPNKLRPQSAAAVVTSHSTPELVRTRLERLEEHGPPSSNQKSSPPRDDAGSRRSSRPLSASSPHRESVQRKPSSPSKGSEPGSPTGSVRSRGSRVSSLQHSAGTNRIVQEWNASHSTAGNTGNPEDQAKNENGEPGPEGDERKVNEPAVELEDMSEERLIEQFGGLPKNTIKRLRRVLAKSSAHSQEIDRTRKAMEKIHYKAQQQHERSSMASQKTELLSSTMDMLIKEPCSLCRHVFLKKNLTTKVSYKSICDLRASWAAKKKIKSTSDNTVESHHSGPATIEDSKADDGLSDPTQVLESTQQISHLYDEVPVCVFCAQLLLDFPSYRPSSAEKKRRQEEKRVQVAERIKQREIQRQLDRLKCDPLDFHSYELNSDEEDDDDQTEEVVEVDDSGRFHVVRRRKPRRRTERVPAQLGLVSKRLHYDHLRSGSVHQLNKKEWEVLISHEK